MVYDYLTETKQGMKGKTMRNQFARDYWTLVKSDRNCYNVAMPVIYKAGNFWYIACRADLFSGGSRYVSKRISAEQAKELSETVKTLDAEFVRSMKKSGGKTSRDYRY